MAANRKAIDLLLAFIDRLHHVARHRWNRILFVFHGSVRCRRLEREPKNRFDVPVWCEGPGVVRIGSGNHFGFKPAPRLGRGQILLQTRGPEAELVIGNRNVFNNNISIIATKRITIGNSCLIGDQVVVIDSDFHEIDPDLRKRSTGPSEAVAIGNNVWLGSRSMVLKGVTVGDNTVVGAMSLVNKSIPANCLAAGNPAKVIRKIE